MSPILSPAEVEALLAALGRGGIPGVPGSGGRGVARPYDFRRPKWVSKEQLRLLQSVHETFARLLGASLTTLARCLVEVHLRGIEQGSYAEFIAALSPPTCVIVFEVEPVRGAAALEFGAPLAFQLVERLLGGAGLLPPRLREFTEVEQRLLERVAVRALGDLEQAWRPAGPCRFRLAGLETNPQLLQLTAPNEGLLSVVFDVRLGETEGRLTLGFPHLLLDPLVPRTGLPAGPAPARRLVSSEERAGLRQHVLRIRLDLRAVLGEVPLAVRELLALRPGDVLSLARPVDAPAVVEIEGVPRLAGRPGLVRRRKAIQVLAVVPRGEVTREPAPSHGFTRLPA